MNYTETKKFTDGRTDRRMDGRTDAEGYNIIRPFFKRAYKNENELHEQNRTNDFLIKENQTNKAVKSYCKYS